MAENREKLTDESLENVVGGVKRIVDNPDDEYANVRSGAGLDTEVLYQVYNGVSVYTTGNVIYRDGYDWYEIYAEGDAGYGWIAGSLIGY